MSWRWSLYSDEPRLDWFADSVLQLQYCNDMNKFIQNLFQCWWVRIWLPKLWVSSCWLWSVLGMCHHVQSQVSLLSAVSGPCQGPEPRPAPLGDVILVIIIAGETFHISKHFCDAAAKVRMCFVCQWRTPLFWDLSRCKGNQFVILNWNRFRPTKRLCCDFDSKQFTALSSISQCIYRSVKVLGWPRWEWIREDVLSLSLVLCAQGESAGEPSELWLSSKSDSFVYGPGHFSVSYIPAFKLTRV